LCLILVNRALSYRLFAFFRVFTMLSGLALALISTTGTIPTLGSGALGRDHTFTGRTYIWDDVRSTAWDNPIFGVGYGSYWQDHRVFPVVGKVNEGHNGYLDAFVETGILGTVLILMIIASYLSKTNREKAYDYNWACLRLVFLLLVLVHNFTETSFLRPTTHLWVLFTFMCFVSPRRGKLRVLKRIS
jgi:exopolysaccharide production protein ExoQ